VPGPVARAMSFSRLELSFGVVESASLSFIPVVKEDTGVWLCGSPDCGEGVGTEEAVGDGSMTGAGVRLEPAVEEAEDGILGQPKGSASAQ
jgi:hypothetical protein